MIIVTAGLLWVDVDAYAGCIAYAELLNLQGKKAIAAAKKSVPNSSITKTLINLGDSKFVFGYDANPDDEYVLIDISDRRFFDANVDLSKVIEIIDHHSGFEDYWTKNDNVKVTIEHIGAACTLVYEKWLQSGFMDQMSAESASLLTAGILDNTLNFKAKITTERDKKAYKKLVTIAKLSDNWPEQYFEECQQYVLSDLAETLHNDTKVIDYVNLVGMHVTVGQFILWDANDLKPEHYKKIKETMDTFGNIWLVNILSISDGKSYFLSENLDVKNWAEKVLGEKFDGNKAISNRLWLRKEIFKQDSNWKVES